MKCSIENITREDIDIIKNSATLHEWISALNFANFIKKEVIGIDEQAYEKIYTTLYAYKLGVIHGKREERVKKINQMDNIKFEI